MFSSRGADIAVREDHSSGSYLRRGIDDFR